MPCAHPTADHFIPLFVTLGAAARADRAVETAVDGYTIGFSKRSFQAA
jgi:4,5-DOPA dioxygenase extradiol